MLSAQQLIDNLKMELAKEYIEPPIDRDGMVVHVEDYMESDGERFEVESIDYGIHNDIDTDRYTWKLWGAGGDIYVPAKDCRHVPRPLSVLDVLRDFAIACEDAGNAGPEVARLIAEYGKKLQLKETA